MDWQEVTALLIVAATAGLFTWARTRRRRFSFQRVTHCGCSANSGSAIKGSVTYHARKGERPRVILKMK